ARALHRERPSALEERPRDEESAAALEQADHHAGQRAVGPALAATPRGRGATARSRGAHLPFASPTRVSYALSRPSSGVVFSLSTARMSGVMPRPCRTPPPPRLRPLGV